MRMCATFSSDGTASYSEDTACMVGEAIGKLRSHSTMGKSLT